MRLEYIIRLLAGTLLLTSIGLGYFVSPGWLLLGLFVGLNLVQSSFTGFCPAEKIFSKILRLDRVDIAPEGRVRSSAIKK